VPAPHSGQKPRERYRVIRLGGSDEQQTGGVTGAKVRSAVIRVRVRDPADTDSTVSPSTTRGTRTE